ncbi:hypothetical protein [Longivirga aurantiaca]|uniref:Carboxypeptidase regulatory-like domain-containing protein n=1 Tax=Longivirga aurantiaca TaxID=1837743 RepID=A0ABW1SX29_9ACTN
MSPLPSARVEAPGPIGVVVMRRLPFALVPALLAGLLVVVAPPAQADTTVVSDAGLPAGWSFTSTRRDGKPADASYAHVEGPASVPTGLGSLAMTSGVHTFTMQLLMGLGAALPAATLSTYEITYRSTAPLSLDLGFYTPTFEGQAVVDLPATATWTTVDLLDQPIHQLVDPKQSEAPGSPFTWAALKAAFPGATIDSLGLLVMPNLTVQTTYVDAVRYGTAGDVTTIDLDTDPIPVITSSTATVSLKAGASTPLSGRVQRPSGDPVASLPVELWTKVWGTGTWVKARTVTTGAEGRFTTTFTPVRQTYVRWRVDEPGYAAAVSATRRVDVTARIWATPSDTTIAGSEPVRVFGKVAPSLAGTTVTLRRVGSATPLGTARVAADSTYGIRGSLPRGTWTVYVTSPTGGGVGGGRSAGLRIVVS